MLDILSHGFSSKWGFWTPGTQLITGMIVGLGVTCLSSDVPVVARRSLES